MVKISRTETGKRIRKLIVERGMTARDVQEAMNLDSPQAVYRWMYGDTLPSLENAVLLGQLLEIPLDAILVLENGKYVCQQIFRLNLFEQSFLLEQAKKENEPNRIQILSENMTSFFHPAFSPTALRRKHAAP